jgi:hypothetical protein
MIGRDNCAFDASRNGLNRQQREGEMTLAVQISAFSIHVYFGKIKSWNTVQ